MTATRLTDDQIYTARQSLSILFQFLSKHHGFVARQWFSCCSGCASSEIASELGNHGKPAVFTHRQDRSGLNDGRTTVFLKFGYVRNSELEQVQPAPKDDAAVGRMIFEAAEAIGLRADWDGESIHTVEIHFGEPEGAVAS